MKYIKNTLEYACLIRQEIDGEERKFEFDCLRIYSDTGNVATDGVTQLSDAEYKALLSNPVFSDMFKRKQFVLMSENEVKAYTTSSDELTRENEELKAKIAELEKDEAKASPAVEKLEKENASLKKQIEALKKKNTKEQKGKDANNQTEATEDNN